MGKLLRSVRQLFKVRAVRESRQRKVWGGSLDMGNQLKLMGRFGQELVLEARN